MTIVGRASIEIRPDTSRFEVDLRSRVERLLRPVTIPVHVDTTKLDRIPVEANRAADLAARALGRIPVDVDAGDMPRQVARAMDAAERLVDAGAKRMAADTRSAFGGVGASLNNSLTRVAAGVGLTQLLFGSVQDRREANRLAAQTEAVIRSTGGAARVSASDVDRLTKAIRAKTAVDDDAVRAGANLLLTFTNIQNRAGRGNDVFNQATEVLVDLAAAMGTDVTSGAVQLGKALNDPLKGITALTRVGVTFTEQQKDQIRNFVETGRVADAQRIILAELRKEFGGSAAAQADDLDRLGLKWEDFTERVGGAGLSVIGALEGIPGPAIEAGAGLAALSLTAVGIHKTVEAVSALRAQVALLDTAGIGGVARNLSGVGAAAAGAFALGRGVVAVVDALERLDDVRVDVPDLQAALAKVDVREALSRVDRRLFDEISDGFRNVADTADRFSVSFTQAAREMNRGGLDKTLDDLDKSLAGLVRGGAAETARDRLQELAEALGRTPDEVLLFLDDYRDAAGRSAAAAATAAAAQREASGATAELGDETGETTAELEAEERAARRLAEALDSAYSASLDLIGSQVGAAEALDRLRDGQDDTTTKERELAEAIRAHGRGSAEAKAAAEALEDARRGQVGDIDALVQANVRLAETQAANAGKTFEAADRYRVYRDELIKVKDTLAPGSPLRAHIESLINQLPPPSVKSEVIADTVKSQATLERFASVSDFVLRDRTTTLDADPTPAEQKLAALDERLGGFSALGATVHVDADTTQADAAVDRLDARLREVRILGASLDVEEEEPEPRRRRRRIFHSGGLVDDIEAGARLRDLATGEVPAVLERGEFVMRRRAVDRLGVDFFERLNRLPRFHEGGAVGAELRIPELTAAPAARDEEVVALLRALVALAEARGDGDASTTYNTTNQISNPDPRAVLEEINRQQARDAARAR